jgi:hypothetical protein
VRSTIVEFDPGTGDEVPHRPRYENLAWVGGRLHAGSDVDGDAADVISPQVDLAGVYSGSDGDTVRCELVSD